MDSSEKKINLTKDSILLTWLIRSQKRQKLPIENDLQRMLELNNLINYCIMHSFLISNSNKEDQNVQLLNQFALEWLVTREVAVLLLLTRALTLR